MLHFEFEGETQKDTEKNKQNLDKARMKKKTFGDALTHTNTEECKNH